MKRFVSVLLTAALVFSFIISFGAENFSTPFCLCDLTDGWNTGSIENGYGENSMACVSTNVKNGTNVIISYNHPTFVNMGGNSYIEFDWYIGDVRILSSNTEMQMELTSSGVCDVEEATWLLDDFLKMNLVSGWNHIKLNLAGKGADMSHINFFRFYMLNVSLEEVDEVAIKFDNMYVTDGNGAVECPLEELFKNNYTSPSVGEDASSCLQYGDLDGTNTVDISDAIKAFRYVAGKEELNGTALLAANVNAQAGVSLTDAMQLFLRVAGKNEAPFLSEKLWQGSTQTGVLGAHLVATTYKTITPVVAVCDVAAFGAYGDGFHDDTAAFNFAFTYAQLNGNGTVFVPAGMYKLSGNLTIPSGVTLCGDKPFNKNMEQISAAVGTVLCVYAGRGEADGTPFITLGAGSGLKNLSVWYPEQTADDITPYPYTISKIGTSCTVSNVYLVNSYNGIFNGGESNALQNYEYVYGTVLNKGIFVTHNYDLCRIENICFSPHFWAACGLGSAQNEGLIASHMYQNATAIEVQRLDWMYFMGIKAIGFKYGLVTTKGDNGSSNGHIYDFEFSGCQTGVFLEYMLNIGFMLTCGTISAENPVVVADTYEGCSATFKNVKLLSTANACVQGGNGSLVFDDCFFDGTAAAIDAANITVSLQDCTFSQQLGKLVVANKKDSKVINPIGDEVKLAGDCAEMKLVYSENEHTADIDIGDVDSTYIYYARPSQPNFIDLSAAPYNIHSSSLDISETLQRAIDDIYKMGGGIVYIGCGRYRLENKITVRPGVELRGSSDGAAHSSAPATLFLTDFGKNDENGDALINLEEYSSIRGFHVLYDKQGDNAEKPVVPYSYTIRASGTNIAVYAVSLYNPYIGADFSTNRCDNHYVKNLDGAPLKNGITLGGKSSGGVVRDCHFNPHYNSSSSIGATWEYQLYHNEGYVVNETKNELMVQNFVYGALSGLVLSNGAQVYSICHGTDGATVGMTFRGAVGEDCTLVDSQLAVLGSASEKHYIKCEEDMQGEVKMLQTCMWGDPIYGVKKAGGSLIMCTGTVAVCGMSFLISTGGFSQVSGLCVGTVTAAIFHAKNASAPMYIFGNIPRQNSFMVRDPKKVVNGSDSL